MERFLEDMPRASISTIALTIVRYRDERLKSDLDYRSPMRHQRGLELIA